MAAKYTHEKVSYQETPNGTEQCSRCSMFVEPGSCTAVRDPILPGGWCTIFEWSNVAKRLAVVKRSIQSLVPLMTTRMMERTRPETNTILDERMSGRRRVKVMDNMDIADDLPARKKPVAAKMAPMLKSQGRDRVEDNQDEDRPGWKQWREGC